MRSKHGHRWLLTTTLLCAVLPVGNAWPQDTSTAKRCVDAQGNTIFTDADCGDIDAVEKPKSPPTSANVLSFARPVITHTCSRSPEDLQWSMQNAIESRDVNDLAVLYDWTGFSSTQAKPVMDRLKAITDSSLLSVELIYPVRRQRWFGPEPEIAPPEESEQPPRPLGDPRTLSPRDAEQEGGGMMRTSDYEGLATTDYQADPVGVVVYAQDAKGERSSSTHFRLLRHHSCWWLRL